MMKFWPLALSLFALGAAPAPPGKFEFVNLESQGNQKLADNFGSGTNGNDLAALKKGQRTCAGVNFKIGEKVIQLGSKLLKAERPNKVEGIKVDQKFAKLHVLHSTLYGQGGAAIEE